jgi:hypothetical protein
MTSPDGGPEPSGESAAPVAPRVFVSYSHDNEEHKGWVLKLSHRLVVNGVDVILDQWDLRLGSDLPLFMEEGLTQADRVLAVCTDNYVRKANAPVGGVGYEKRILTASVMDDLRSDQVIPIVRHNDTGKLPTFLGSAVYVDFRDDAEFEAKYAHLLSEIHGRPMTSRPPLGRNPFLDAESEEDAQMHLRHHPARYVSPQLSGATVFPYTNNSGRYLLGNGEMSFTFSVSSSGHGAVYVMNDPADIRLVALAKGVVAPNSVSDARQYDGSSRLRTVRVGDAAILNNAGGYWAVVCLDEVTTRDTDPEGEPTMRFRYLIQSDRGADFTNLPAVDA